MPRDAAVDCSLGAGSDRQDFEIIVVDDGSTDGRAMRCAVSLVDRYIRQTNQGCRRSQRRRRACCQYVCLLDSDDLWFPTNK
jgi:glycosyltransferase involved in cell wall biosynthesis